VLFKQFYDMSFERGVVAFHVHCPALVIVTASRKANVSQQCFYRIRVLQGADQNRLFTV